MVSVYEFGMLDTGSSCELQILTLKSIITMHSKFTRALPNTEPDRSSAVEKGL